MNKHQKKEILTKLREINRLDRRKRNSDKSLCGQNCHISNNTSFTRDPIIAPEDSHSKFIHTFSARKFEASQPQLIKQLQDQSKQLPLQLSNNTTPTKFIKVQNIKQPIGNLEKVKAHRFFYQKQTNSNKQDPSRVFQTQSSFIEAPESHFQHLRIRCKQCQKLVHAKDEKIQSLERELKQMRTKLRQAEQQINNIKDAVNPYINNVNLMSVVVDSLQEKQWNKIVEQAKPQQQEHVVEDEREPQIQETIRVNKYLLRESRQKDKLFSNQIYRLKLQIDALMSQNTSLKSSNMTKQAKMRTLQQQLHHCQSSDAARERIQMSFEEIYAYKLRFEQKNKQNKQLTIKNEEIKYKLNALTSLIGCAIIFDLKEKQKDKKCLKQFINKIDKYQTVTHSLLQNNGFHYLKFLEALHKEQQGTKVDSRNKLKTYVKQKTQINLQLGSQAYFCRKLYLPNYLSLLSEQSISTAAQPIVIKPALFIKLRSILDSKYIDYRLYEGSCSLFSDFCNSHIRNYEIQQCQKKVYLSARQIPENQVKEINMNFMKCLLEERIQDLPQIEVFREFMLGKYEEDEIYFYLMCRHKFVEGSELENFINSGDPSKLIKFDKAKRLVLKITEKFGRNIQNFICYHINERKIHKNGQQFIRLYYMLKLLLLVYRKIRGKKIEELKLFFDGLMQTTVKDTFQFQQFYQLLKKNFQFLMRSQICNMYRTTLAVLESQKTNTHFFQCFFATCGSKIFLIELIRYDKQLQFDCMAESQIINFQHEPTVVQKNCNYRFRASKLQTRQVHRNSYFKTIKESPKVNQLNQLWPDSVYILGSERLNKDYVQLLRSNYQRPRTKLEMLTFLISLAQGHLIKQNIHLKGLEDLSQILEDAIYNLIQFLNKIQKRSLQHENQINGASRKIGKFFKNKIYQFYHQMLQDINNITHETPAKDLKKNKRYLKEKERASKIFLPKYP